MTQYIADFVCGCQRGVSGSAPEEVVRKAVKHAGQAPNRLEVPAEISQRLKAAIRQSMWRSGQISRKSIS